MNATVQERQAFQVYHTTQYCATVPTCHARRNLQSYTDVGLLNDTLRTQLCFDARAVLDCAQLRESGI